MIESEPGQIGPLEYARLIPALGDDAELPPCGEGAQSDKRGRPAYYGAKRWGRRPANGERRPE